MTGLMTLMATKTQKITGMTHGGEEEMSKPSIYEPFTREEFVRGIADYHIGEWGQSYDEPGVLDGTQRGIRIEYGDGREPVEIDGFGELLNLLEIDNIDTDKISDDELRDNL